MLYSTTASSFQRNSCTRTCFLQTEKHVISIEPCFSTIRETREMKWNTLLCSKMAYFHLFMKECDISKDYFTKKTKLLAGNVSLGGRCRRKKHSQPQNQKTWRKQRTQDLEKTKNTKQRKLLNKSRKKSRLFRKYGPSTKTLCFFVYIYNIYFLVFSRFFLKGSAAGFKGIVSEYVVFLADINERVQETWTKCRKVLSAVLPINIYFTKYTTIQSST